MTLVRLASVGGWAWLLAIAVGAAAPAASVAGAAPAAIGGADATITVDITPTHVVQTFDPRFAFGSTVDKEPAGSIPRIYSAGNVQQMLSAGWGFLSYRLYTELSDQDWHWNPAGSFSAGSQGYWTSSASLGAPIADSFGYRLAHRGNATDQGDLVDFSRLDDGDPQTYWKSDPYLAHEFTGDPDDQHPQWAVVDLGSAQPVDAVRIAWADPFATDYRVQYFTGLDAIGDPANGRWTTFTHGSVRGGGGGTATLALAPSPLRVRFVRIMMSRSSGTCDSHGAADRRDCAGYAIEELGVGTLDAAGAFRDLVVHTPCAGRMGGDRGCGRAQTVTYVSSVDPWHDASSRVRYQEQPGLDLIARGGLTRGLPAFYPVPMLYSTPENAAAEVRYLEARGYSILGVELGEEPDGQYTEPEDDGALYLQWAAAIHAVDPKVKLGGPVFSGVNSDLLWWPDPSGTTSWLKRFLAYLKRHGRLGDLAFMSFEHYPFDGCEHGDKLRADLLQEPAIVRTVVGAWRADGLPASVPMYVTEANFTAVNFSQIPMQVEGALWQADYMASALTDGVRGAVYYQYEPVPLSRDHDCPDDWGNLTMFAADDRAVIRARTAQFWAADMLTKRWTAPDDRADALYPANGDLVDAGAPIVTAYAVKRRDGTWSLLLINKDGKPHGVRVRFVNYGGGLRGPASGFDGTVGVVTFGSAQYAWHQRGAASAPSPNGPPAESSAEADDQTVFTLPAESMTVLRGSLGHPRL